MLLPLQGAFGFALFISQGVALGYGLLPLRGVLLYFWHALLYLHFCCSILLVQRTKKSLVRIFWVLSVQHYCICPQIVTRFNGGLCNELVARTGCLMLLKSHFSGLVHQLSACKTATLALQYCYYWNVRVAVLQRTRGFIMSKAHENDVLNL